MSRMLHRSEYTVEQRLEAAEENQIKIRLLLDMGWTDIAIGGYVGLDQYTIKRFRKKHNIVGRRSERCPDYSTIQ